MNGPAEVVSQVLQRGRFFIAPARRLWVEFKEDVCLPWEMWGGRLLDERQTRSTRTIQAWEISFPEGANASPPLVSVFFAAEEKAFYVVRHILMRGFEPYEDEDAPNVVLSRPAEKWTRELVGTVRLGGRQPPDASLPRPVRQLGRLLFLAFCGTSRLPVTSLESPLPQFSLGQVAYFFSAAPRVATTPGELIDQVVDNWQANDALEPAKRIEMALRAAEADEIGPLSARLVDGCREAGVPLATIPTWIKTLFHHVSLTPYTRLCPNLARLLVELSRDDLLGLPAVIDVAGYLLRHLVRHLTAFDLKRFHNGGADYPDALLLDELLGLYMRWIAESPAEFLNPRQRLRRRALRQAWLLRKHYGNLPVPDVPTSPGENARVLSGEFVYVDEQQLHDPASRTRRLFAGDPWRAPSGPAAGQVFQQAFDDLSHEAELRELGTAVFLDRPLGAAKAPSEVDRTELLSYEAFSRQVAHERIDELQRWGLIDEQAAASFRGKIESMEVTGCPAADYRGRQRPGVVALEDAGVRSADFVFQRTTKSSLARFFTRFDFRPLKEPAPETYHWLREGKGVLLIRPAEWTADSHGPLLQAWDESMTQRLVLATAPDFIETAGDEFPRRGLHVVSFREPGRPRQTSPEQELWLPPREFA